MGGADRDTVETIRLDSQSSKARALNQIKGASVFAETSFKS